MQKVFKSELAQQIIEYVKKKYNGELEFLWKKFPRNAIWRNQRNRKWYGALLVVEKKKIGINEEGEIEIIDLLAQPEKIEKLIDGEKYLTGYHMNKKHWLTIKLDGSVNLKKICDFIDQSYQLTAKK
ncbi:MAG: MmcQ/YjbR family DNA-binding protein [bacterium]|nr:MmcQ/YjbR family DNA-binding protein [bacterium]